MHLFSRCRLVRFRGAVGMKDNQGEAPGWLIGSCWLWNVRSFLPISDNLKLKWPGFLHAKRDETRNVWTFWRASWGKNSMFMTLRMAGWLDNSWILWLLGGSVEWKQLEGECTPCISTMLGIFDAPLMSVQYGVFERFSQCSVVIPLDSRQESLAWDSYGDM